MGGDEFAVISQGSNLERLDELLSSVASHNEEAARGGGIVIACGTALYEEGKDESVDAVFERADRLMYENKNRLKT